jgi:hypothetical protein
MKHTHAGARACVVGGGWRAGGGLTARGARALHWSQKVTAKTRVRARPWALAGLARGLDS